jgi:hypothetical protein
VGRGWRECWRKGMGKWKGMWKGKWKWICRVLKKCWRTLTRRMKMKMKSKIEWRNYVASKRSSVLGIRIISAHMLVRFFLDGSSRNLSLVFFTARTSCRCAF